MRPFKSCTASVQGNAPGKSFFVGVEVFERRLRITPAVVAAAAVEIDQPEPLYLDAQGEKTLGPFSQNLAQFVDLSLLDLEGLLDRRLPEKICCFLERLFGDANDLREKINRLLVRELLRLQNSSPLLSICERM